MRTLLELEPRLWLCTGLAVLAAPPAIVALAGVGVPLALAGIVVIPGAALAVAWGWRRLPPAFARPMRGRPLLLAAWIVLVGVAATHTVRLSTFVHDVDRADLSVLPERDFFRKHACLSAYTEASRLAPSGQNIYDPASYMGRTISRLEVDLFQYPPAFLLLGGSLNAVGHNFLASRAIWYGVQALTLMVVALLLAWWIGGETGAWAGWTIPVVWLATPTLLVLQLGNFQLSAFAWSVGAMLLAAAGWFVPAGAVLGFCAAGKVFPGVLVLYMAARTRWRPVVSTAVWALVWLLVAIAWFGMKPQWDFLQYQVPRIQSGEAFFWMDDPTAAAINNSIYGLVVRLRALGVPGMTRGAGNALASVYGAAVLAVGAYAGWRRRRVEAVDEHARLSEAIVWLALLNLGSLRSPFVPDAYSYIGTLWLGTLVMAGLSQRTTSATCTAIVAWVAFTRVFDGLLADGATTPTWMVATSLAIQVAAYGFNIWALARALWPQALGASSR